MTDNKKVVAIIPAAGKGTRFGGDKIFSLLCGKPVLIHTLITICSSVMIDEIIITTRQDLIHKVAELVKAFGINKVVAITTGGEQRQDSVFNGLKHISSNPDYVLIHDGARPLVSKSIIEYAINELTQGDFDGVVVGLPLKDTIKRVVIDNDKNTVVVETPKREEFWSVQTPQVFRYQVLISSFQRASKDGFYSTDDSAIVERYGGRIRLILGQHHNIKITTKDDIFVAEQFLKKRLPDV
ncbi:MAG: 2-C-methyl-D-erythritol 4-phosphate cytidylyltransferase [Thermodesulfovibrionales bacterium]|nr:2-C-methyl-D-erythritol 4-phosphate cytidylyltransferase [Thermodesulfovibrionales bacterium]